jgi:hypothetical protein
VPLTMFFITYEVCVWVVMSRNCVILDQDRRSTCNMTRRRVSVTIVAVEKQNYDTTELLFLALGLQHAMRTLCPTI